MGFLSLLEPQGTQTNSKKFPESSRKIFRQETLSICIPSEMVDPGRVGTVPSTYGRLWSIFNATYDMMYQTEQKKLQEIHFGSLRYKKWRRRIDGKFTCKKVKMKEVDTLKWWENKWGKVKSFLCMRWTWIHKPQKPRPQPFICFFLCNMISVMASLENLWLHQLNTISDSMDLMHCCPSALPRAQSASFSFSFSFEPTMEEKE